VEVPIWNKNDDVLARVGSKREDAHDGRFRCCECAIVTSTEAAFDTRAISEGEEGNNKVVRVGDGEDVDRAVVLGGLVGKVNDGLRERRCNRGVEGGEDSGVGPCETCGNAKRGEGGREEGGERGGDGVGRDVEGGGIIGGEGAKESSGWEFRKADGERLAVLGNGVFDWGDGKHVVQGVDRVCVKGAADLTYSDVLSNLEDMD